MVRIFPECKKDIPAAVTESIVNEVFTASNEIEESALSARSVTVTEPLNVFGNGFE